MYRTESEPKYWKDENGKVKTKYYELREEKIRIEGIIDTLKETINQITDQVRERLSVNLKELFNLAEINPNKSLT